MYVTSKEVTAFYEQSPLTLLSWSWHLKQEASTEASVLWKLPAVFTPPLPSAVLSLWLSIWRYNHSFLTSLFFWFIPAAELEERSISVDTKKLHEGGDSQGYRISKYNVVFVNQSLSSIFPDALRRLPYYFSWDESCCSDCYNDPQSSRRCKIMFRIWFSKAEVDCIFK